MQTKPKAKTRDPLSEKNWQQTFIWKFTNCRAPEVPKKPISDRTLNILIAGFIIIMSLFAVGIIREVYIKVAEKECINWENRPLDQVSIRCLKQ